MTTLVVRLINLFIGVVETVLLLRLGLRLFAANPNAPFVAWIYSASEEMLSPFRNIFPARTVEPGYVFEFSTLFAIVMYAILGSLLIGLVYLVRDATRVAPPKEIKRTTLPPQTPERKIRV